MVMVFVILALIAIMMSVAVQAVSFQMQREKEAELIFRGQQYVEAIRLYQKRFGRLPVSLKEMWEAKPRVVRRQWEDPITGTTEWGLVFMGQEGRQIGPTGKTTPTPGPAPTPTPGPGRRPGPGGPGQGEQIGPIIGVYSTSCEESIKVYEGRTRYCDWKFVYRERQQRQRKQ